MLFRTAAARVATRAFSSSAAARKDLVQDLYLKELKAYKPAASTKDAHVGLVKAFSAPIAPSAPTLPADLASELSAYDASEPAIAEAPAAVASSDPAAEAGAGAEAFLSFLEADLPKPEVHHH
ncbi:hypothetical protein CYLTODRAFT_422581 [Cylindrobasidium torrendii FP15055 ss-10]|uniref:ATP synthase complex subunit H n=1 Tax=Cylindrobasidium torrendii FP15055 ss-10 TaxID=1314674 RepID=A0A0D7BCY1_9AGAR|nr:hypothetical protein CYLTODRAFT_422581 [Cylindrobasidium torrendii FP15055 ss-10]